MAKTNWVIVESPAKAKTIGKMLDNQLTVEGLFSIVLMAHTDEFYQL